MPENLLVRLQYRKHLRIARCVWRVHPGPQCLVRPTRVLRLLSHAQSLCCSQVSRPLTRH